MTIYGMQVGSLAEWVGNIGTIATIFFTIRYYNKDNRVSLGMNLDQKIVDVDENRKIISGGWTLSAMNISPVPSAFIFLGIRWKENIITTFFINLLNYFIPSKNRIIESIKPRMIEKRDSLMNTLLTEPEIMMGPKKNEMMKVAPYDTLPTQTFPTDYLIDNLARLTFEQYRLVNRFLEKKPVTVIATYMRYDGKVYKLTLRLSPSSSRNSYYLRILHSMHRFLTR